MLLQLIANGVVNGVILALVATGFALIYNTLRIFHIAQGAVYVIAGYACAFLVTRLHWGPSLAAVAAVLFAAAVGCGIEGLVYWPLHKRSASKPVCLLSSLGLYVALVNLIALAFGSEPKLVPGVVDGSWRMGGVILTQVQVLQALVGTAILVPVFLLLKHSRWGRLVRAVRDNPKLALAVGLDLRSIRSGVMAIGSILAGVAGALSAIDVGIDPTAGMPILLVASVAVIVGGLGTFLGPLAGALVVALLQSLAVWKISARWSDIVTFSVLLLFLLLRPEGLLGRHRRIEEALD